MMLPQPSAPALRTTRGHAINQSESRLDPRVAPLVRTTSSRLARDLRHSCCWACRRLKTAPPVWAETRSSRPSTPGRHLLGLQAVLQASRIWGFRRIYVWMHAARLRPSGGRRSQDGRSAPSCSAADRGFRPAAWPSPGDRRRHRLRTGPRGLAALVALASVAALIAGCGGGSSLGVASIASSSRSGSHRSSSRPSGGGVGFVGVAASPAQRAGAEVSALLFSRCMRSHGVPGFPDPPAASRGGIRFGIGGGGIDPAAPLFRVAQRRCISLLIRRRAGAG